MELFSLMALVSAAVSHERGDLDWRSSLKQAMAQLLLLPGAGALARCGRFMERSRAPSPAAMHSVPSRVFRSDCLSVVRALRRGYAALTAAGSKCARAWGIIHDANDGDPDLDLAWIPAHTTEAYVPERISAFDKHGNVIADEHAKLVASEHAIAQDMLDVITNQDELVSIVALWIGHAGVIVSPPGMRDSAGCPSARRARRAETARRKAAASAGACGLSILVGIAWLMRLADGDAAFARWSHLRGSGWRGAGAQVRLRPCGQTWLEVMRWPDRSADEGTRVGSPMPPFGATGAANMRCRQQSASQGLVNP